MGPVARTRTVACAVAVFTVAVGVGVRVAMAGEVAKYAGDALYTVLVYVLVVLIAPRVRPPVAAGVALLFSTAVELFQLTPIPAELARESVAMRLVLGSTFNAPDLLWYAAGAALSALVHTAAGRSAARTAGASVE
ncbi:DUF2809 domain-containing protein [Streptomyces sp. NPDC008150]|uniref:ribosomal maturation YjgA family protein n=1 Tax=Streptomyces sp. NPDC008150 TaxID=3364816 RepID=UPI0036E3AA31